MGGNLHIYENNDKKRLYLCVIIEDQGNFDQKKTNSQSNSSLVSIKYTCVSGLNQSSS